MIEHIRKYTGLIIVGFALVVFSLVIGIKDDLFLRNPAGRGVLKIAGRTYDEAEFRSLGSGSFELASSLARAGDFGLYQFVMGLSTGATSQDDAAEKFFIGRMILRKAKTEFGIHPGEKEVSDYIRSLRAFAGPEGKFSEENYRNFVEKGIGRLGMTEGDLRELASDVLASRKLTTIIGSGLTSNREVVSEILALDNEQIDGSIASLSIDPFEAEIDPTDEEIKAYWEVIQDAFTTEPLRKFTYILVAPDMPEDLAEDEAEEAESIADAALSDEAKKEKADKKAAEKAEKVAAHAEARRLKQLELDAMVDDFTFELEQQKGVGFEELAKENQWEVQTTELFSTTTVPSGLDIKLRSSSRGGNAVDELFRIEETSDPVSKISQPIAVGENQWLVARLDGEEKSRPKTFEEAKEEARDKYIVEKAAEAMKAAADEAVTKINEALAAGKSFADGAKDAGLSEVKEVTKVTSTYRPDPIDEPKNLFEVGRNVDPGTLAPIITETDRTFIFFVAKREVVKNDDAAARIDAEVTSKASQNELLAFTSWITARTEAAKVERLYR